jgi:ABC-2 type transport system permease protein
MTTPTTEVGTVAAVRLVAGREIRTRTSSKAFRITTVVLIIAVVGFVVTLKLVGGDSTGTVGFTSATAPLAQPFVSVASAVGKQVTVRTVDPAAGEQQVRDGTLDALVTGTPDAMRVVVKKDLPDDLRSAFAVLARQVALNHQITQAGGDPAAVSAAVDRATFDVAPLEPAREYQTARLVLGIIAGILVYVSLVLYGQAVAQGVVEEKSSRIVEILLTTIRPWQLMLGKVAGIGLVGLLQLFVVVIAGVVAGEATGEVDFPASIAVGAAAWSVVWFLLGFLVYALVFAALGALVSRQEDVGGVTAPALMMIVLPYILGISILPADPENQFLAIASLIPLFSPTLMPMRIALGVAPGWQIALSISLTVGLIVVFVWLAGRIYGNAVLRTGSRVRLRDALAAAK